MTLPIISLILPHLFDIARTVVRDEIVQEVQRIPEVQHVTGSEPHWYQQRSKWSAIVSGILVVRRRSSPASGSPSARSCRR